MSDEEQRQVIGAMVLRYGQAKKALALASGEGQRIADAFHSLGTVLSRGEIHAAKFADGAVTVPDYRGVGAQKKLALADFDLARIERLATEATEAHRVMKELEPQMRELGLLER